MAACLYQNVARAHLNGCVLRDNRFGHRVLSGGHPVLDRDAAALHAGAGS